MGQTSNQLQISRQQKGLTVDDGHHLLTDSRRVIALETETEAFDPAEHVVDDLAGLLLGNGVLDNAEAVANEIIPEVAIYGVAREVKAITRRDTNGLALVVLLVGLEHGLDIGVHLHVTVAGHDGRAAGVI